MGYFTTEQIEEISLEKLSQMIRKTGKQKIKTQLNSNDKEPSWDGHFILYNEENNWSKDNISSRIPVQIKGTEVRKFSKVFKSFPIKIADLNNYFYDGGVIFIVVEIKGEGKEESKIFYRLLLPRDLQMLLDEAKINKNTTKNVHIDCILDDKKDFYSECKIFEIEKQYQSVASVKNALPLSELNADKIEFVSIDNPINVFDRNIYPYVRDNYGQLIPVKEIFKVSQIRMSIEKDLIIKDKKYFDRYDELYDDNGIKYYEIGDKVLIKKGELTVQKSEKNIFERLNTLNFLFDIVDIDNVKDDKEKRELKILEDEREYINKIIQICNRYNIKKEEINLSKISNEDHAFLDILGSAKDSLDNYKHGSKIEFKIIPYVNKKILMLKISSNEHHEYYNYYSEKFNMGVICKLDNKSIMLNRFICLKKEALLCENFEKKVVMNEFIKKNDESMRISYDYYMLFVLELIKAWDCSNNIDYLEVAEYILKLMKDDEDNREILTINEAQIEYRKNGEISHNTKDKLYEFKFRDRRKNKELKLAILILLEDYKSFNESFNELDNEGQERFKQYPIYSLYLKNINKIID